MIRANPRTNRRAGFTLVEVLVVVAIIAVLVSLTAAAVFKIYGEGDKLVARKDISDLAIAVDSFKNYFHVDHVPSRIRLREQGDYVLGQGIQIEDDSYAFLKRVWPKLSFNTQAYPAIGAGVDWNANGTIDPGYTDLEGHQCLVFFLGGIQQANPPGCLGFSTSPSHPETPPGVILVPGQPPNNERIPQFFEFKGERLVYVPSVATGQPNGYFSFQDAFRKTALDPNLNKQVPVVYAYFSSGKKQNGYNRYYDASGVSDCPSLLAEDPTNPGQKPVKLVYGVWPYAQVLNGSTSPQYLNPSNFQIICAGPDGVFGNGTIVTSHVNFVWSGGPMWNPQSTGSLVPRGQDDFSNFYEKQLGSGD